MESRNWQVKKEEVSSCVYFSQGEWCYAESACAGLCSFCSTQFCNVGVNKQFSLQSVVSLFLTRDNIRLRTLPIMYGILFREVSLFPQSCCNR